MYRLSSQEPESKIQPDSAQPHQEPPHFPRALLLPFLASLVTCSYALLGLGCELPQRSPELSRKTSVLLGQMGSLLFLLQK